MVTYKLLDEAAKRFGESFYLIDSSQIVRNYERMIHAFQKVYQNTLITYSYKTNYTPRICKLINSFRGGRKWYLRWSFGWLRI